MQYMGGKSKIAKRLMDALLKDTSLRDRWLEPFVGGGSVLMHAVPHFGRCVAMDAHPDLMMMWQAVADGWDPPDSVSRELYYELKAAEPSALRGYAGFGTSFGGKWWGGYSGNHVRRFPDGHEYRIDQSAFRSLMKQAGVIRSGSVRFRHGDFGTLTPPPETVVYCDPPYRDTTGYTTGDFDHGAFYKTLLTWADDGCAVYVSEYQPPLDVTYRVVWTKNTSQRMDKTGNSGVITESLYRIGES